MKRLLVSIVAGVGLACTATTGDDDESSGTQPPASATGSSGASTEEPTSAGMVSGESSGESGSAETGAVPEVSFTEVFEQVIMPGACNSGYCHGGGAGGLELTDEATSYANLVEMSATLAACGQTTRVVPGSLEASVLWYRVRPAALDAGMPCAPKMPQGSMGLAEAQAQLVSDWIVGGALE